MSLYASKKAIEITIKLFTELHECESCGKFFTELENVGCWDCKYHPGEYDNVRDCYTCCGETRTRPAFHHVQYGHLMTWPTRDRWNHIQELSDGCCRKDCMPKRDTPIPKDVLTVEDIATLIPYMERPIEKRAGLKKGPLRLLRSENRPYDLWTKVPLNIM